LLTIIIIATKETKIRHLPLIAIYSLNWVAKVNCVFSGVLSWICCISFCVAEELDCYWVVEFSSVFVVETAPGNSDG
jgi:hypothetical protein